jgi:uncharacterized small protein (DUF1192 family)
MAVIVEGRDMPWVYRIADKHASVRYRWAMPLFDEEDRPRKKLAHEIGEDLAKLSLDELAARVELLKAEILRLESAAAAKKASAESASAFFKK